MKKLGVSRFPAYVMLHFSYSMYWGSRGSCIDLSSLLNIFLVLQRVTWTISVGIGNLIRVQRGSRKYAIYKPLPNFLQIVKWFKGCSKFKLVRSLSYMLLFPTKAIFNIRKVIYANINRNKWIIGERWRV